MISVSPAAPAFPSLSLARSGRCRDPLVDRGEKAGDRVAYRGEDVMLAAKPGDDSVARIPFHRPSCEPVGMHRIERVAGRGAIMGDHRIDGAVVELGALGPADRDTF